MKGFVFFISLLSTISIFAQSERKFIRDGNSSYDNKKYAEGEIAYRKALDKNSKSYEAAFNVGNALYKQGKYLDAASQFSTLTEATKDKDKLSKLYYNLGNSYVRANKFDEAIEAYKKALLQNPNDKDTKFNLAYTQHLVKQQKQDPDNKDQKDVDPSEHAKKIKKQADELVSQRKYAEAYQLMTNLIQHDKTAVSYQDYIKRLKDVVEINSI